MLRVIQQNSPDDAKRYYTKADYLSEGQELAGRWGGRAARMLGLEGEVDKQSFDRLCDNLHPETGERLTARTRSDRTVGYDFTWSVPKSVSVRYALTGDERILDAFRSAVAETMQDIEAEMKTRVRKDGKDENRTVANMCFAEFIHKTARPIQGIPDAHLHSHTFCFNFCWDMQEQQFKAGQFRELKASAPYYQSVMRVRLANKLQELGIPILRKRDDFEIATTPASVITKNSRRTEEIERIAAERGITDPKVKDGLGAESREHKNDALSWNQLQEEWRSWLTDAEYAAVMTPYEPVGPSGRQVGGEKLAVDHAIQHCFVREEVLSERKLLTEALKRGLGSVTLEDVKKELARRPLIRGEYDGQACATTQELKQAGEWLLGFVRGGRGKLRPLISGEYRCTREYLNAGQKAAVRHVLNISRDTVTLIRGPAGVGKTELEGELRTGLQAAGVPVVAVAQSTTAVDELRDTAGFSEAATIAHFVRDERMQASIRGGLLLVDEGSLIGTRDMAHLFRIVGEQNARIVLVGDVAQHRSVNAGEPMRLMSERAGLPVVEVTEIVRQEEGDYRKVAQALSEGKTATAFAELDRLGWVREIDHGGRYWVMAQGYLSTIREKKKNKKPKTALCVSPTHAECARVTAFIRSALKQDGKLGEERTLPVWIPSYLTDPEKADATQYEPGDMLQWHQNSPGHVSGSRLRVEEGAALPLDHSERFEVFRPSELPLAVHDRIRITKNGQTKDGKHALKNGMLVTLDGYTKQGDLIVNKNWIISKDWGHIAHGYCVTSHHAEGRSVDKVFAAMSSESFGATNQRTAYVAWTRGKEQAVVFTDSKEALQRAIERPDQPISAVEFAEESGTPKRGERLKAQFDQRLRLGNAERGAGQERAQVLHQELSHER